MKKEFKIAFKITYYVFLIIVFSFIFTFFFFSKESDIFEFLISFWKNFAKDPKKIIPLVLNIFVILVGIFFIIYFSFKKDFEKLNEYNKNLENYNHYLAHELKTPISVISSNLEVLKYGFDERIVKNSQNTLKSMNSIIDILLNFSENFNIFEKEDINLKNYIEYFIDKYFAEFKKNIFIENKEFNFSIYTNEVLFGRIIRNLLENAIKYSVDSKVFIKIENKKLYFTNLALENFSKKDLEQLETKFYRSNKTTNGYGLGLPLIKEILHFLGYKMSLNSKNKNFIVEISFLEGE